MVRLEFDVVKELAEERAHREGKTTFQVVGKEDRLAVARSRPNFVVGGVAHRDVFFSAQHSLTAETYNDLGGDDGTPPVAIAFADGHGCLQLEVGLAEVRGGEARPRGALRQGRRVRVTDEERKKRRTSDHGCRTCFAVVSKTCSSGSGRETGDARKNQEKSKEAREGKTRPGRPI